MKIKFLVFAALLLLLFAGFVFLRFLWRWMLPAVLVLTAVWWLTRRGKSRKGKR